MGVNYSLTGVFYNKTLAAQVGMTKAPATLAELDADYEFMRADVGADVVCPTCGTVHTNDFANKFGLISDAETCREFLLELQPNSASETPNADITTPIETDFLEPSENITFSLAFALLLRVIRNLECPNRVEHQAVALSARDVTAGEFLLL